MNPRYDTKMDDIRDDREKGLRLLAEFPEKPVRRIESSEDIDKMKLKLVRPAYESRKPCAWL